MHQLCSLTMGNVLLGKKVFVHVHGEVHHVCLTEEVQLSMKQFLLIIDLKT